MVNRRRHPAEGGGDVGLALTRRDLLRGGAALTGASLLSLGGPGCGPPELKEPRSWIWTGGLGARTARVHARVVGDPEPTLTLSSVRDPSSFVRLEPDAVGRSGVASFVLPELTPETAYRYEVGSMGGRFRTAAAGPTSYRVAFGSCADTRSDHPVFDAIVARDPLFFLHLGDLHYRDIDENDRVRFLRAYDEALSTPAQSRFFSQIPVEYVWDDHDFGPNDSDRTAPGLEAASSAYREVVPRHPLALAGPTAPVGRAFSVGRVRYVVTDLRAGRSPRDVRNPTILGRAQKAWLLDELSSASQSHALVIWVSPVPWIADGGDDWGGYREERREIANHIVTHGIRNLAMLAGDAHMVAIDDGRNNTYASVGPGPGFPVFHASALDRSGSVKGGPYSKGTIAGGGHFGEMDLEDDGSGPVRVRWRGRDAQGRVLMSYTFTASAA